MVAAFAGYPGIGRLVGSNQWGQIHPIHSAAPRPVLGCTRVPTPKRDFLNVRICRVPRFEDWKVAVETVAVPMAGRRGGARRLELPIGDAATRRWSLGLVPGKTMAEVALVGLPRPPGGSGVNKTADECAGDAQPQEPR